LEAARFFSGLRSLFLLALLVMALKRAIIRFIYTILQKLYTAWSKFVRMLLFGAQNCEFDGFLLPFTVQIDFSGTSVRSRVQSLDSTGAFSAVELFTPV